jgi:hypothetical protein
MPVPVVPVRTDHSVRIRRSLKVSTVGPVNASSIGSSSDSPLCPDTRSLEVSRVGPVNTSSSGSSSDSPLCPDTQFSGSQRHEYTVPSNLSASGTAIQNISKYTICASVLNVLYT